MTNSIITVSAIFYIVFSFFYYIKAGGGYILPSAIFYLSSAFFIFVPQVYSYGVLGNPVETSDLIAILACWWITIVGGGLSLYHSRHISKSLYLLPSVYGFSSRRKFSFQYSLVMVLFCTCMIILLGSVYDGPWVSRFYELVVISLSFLVFFYGNKKSLNSLLFLLIWLGVSIYYALVVFDGGGRLSLMVTLLSIFQIWLFSVGGSMNAKKLSVIGIFPLAIILGLIRGNGAGIASVATEGDGLSSVFAPYLTFVELVDLQLSEGINYLYGETYVASFLFWIPRELWEQKPIGFGAELTQILRPGLVGSGHSMAAGYWGELMMNGGWLLIFAFPLLLSFFMYRFDVIYKNIIKSRCAGGLCGVKVFIVVIISSGIATFVWVGFFTFFSRDILKTLIVSFVFMMCFFLLRVSRR